MRIAEIISDYRNIQTHIANMRTSPSAEEYHEECHTILRQSVAAAQTLLAHPFQPPSPGAKGSDDEAIKSQLRQYISPIFQQASALADSQLTPACRVIFDAAIRRFRAQKIYLQATAALRGVSNRSRVLQGQRPTAAHGPALQRISNQLRTVSTHTF